MNDSIVAATLMPTLVIYIISISFSVPICTDTEQGDKGQLLIHLHIAETHFVLFK